MNFGTTLNISAAGLAAEGTRLQIIAQNLANVQSTGSSPGSTPYRRQTVSFADRMSSATGVKMVKVSQIGQDQAPFPLKYDPSNPAANKQGYVKMPNVNSFVELMDMQQAQRAYNADLAAMNASRSMLSRTLGLL
ncbi:MAG TPA: flagellar basal body rod protein FlgC [Acidiphilium sp.]|nr:MAG: flagellar basal body rod protein FlgC [Acidiphilium sp. 21-60-14]OYV90223.1 MAG: flagellar basal body rod protein FlgC [Acidiphilium sp. 37-60-79]OZB39586.1 MAG: flagellar basal body rod protein FlgC [Acidiphilium sp. 34-60-192]HQT88333.1 flagellar basal body rod protein FlgC [Acidiphilium sp.]HQU23382.1 flagellar basal body rod protein FlgC [Acidiphilium sp.]